MTPLTDPARWEALAFAREGYLHTKFWHVTITR